MSYEVTPPENPDVTVSAPTSQNVTASVTAPRASASLVAGQGADASVPDPEDVNVVPPHIQMATATVIGPPGGQGPPGPPGPAGPPGGNLRYVQSTPATTWAIEHALGFMPSVTAVDSTGRVILPEAEYPSITTVVLTFSAAVAGEAYLS